MHRRIASYLAAVAVAVAGAVALLHWGTLLHPVASALPATAAEPGAIERLHQPLTLLLIQIVVVLGAARLCGHLMRRLGQPMVMGEILAGILLGPSLLGLVAPGALAWLFPPESMQTLGVLAQVGVLLFMFVVGLEVDLSRQFSQGRAAVAVSHAGIALPFLLGIGLAFASYDALALPDEPFVAFALFLGIAMSVTAFPVLARILKESNLSQTPLGQQALASAAIGDVAAWCLLAAVVAIVKGHALADTAWTLALTVVFGAVMIGVVRRPLERLVDAFYVPGGREGYPLIAGMLIFAFGSAMLTELIGIHALFGAFLAGTLIAGKHDFRQYLHDRVLPLSSLIMLPLFFAQVGLRTRVSALDSLEDWLWCGLIIVIATTGKLGGCTLAARWSGTPWRESLALGALMNTRGLMELIVLNIGYELGLLSERVFTMLVIMALVTTFMTGPLLNAILKRRPATPA
ncbi:MAG: cation:proton antiporter [Gammaproteobacteria bacterium]